VTSCFSAVCCPGTIFSWACRSRGFSLPCVILQSKTCHEREPASSPARVLEAHCGRSWGQHRSLGTQLLVPCPQSRGAATGSRGGSLSRLAQVLCPGRAACAPFFGKDEPREMAALRLSRIHPRFLSSDKQQPRQGVMEWLCQDLPALLALASPAGRAGGDAEVGCPTEQSKGAI